MISSIPRTGDGGHGDVAPANMGKIFDSFDAHRRQESEFINGGQ